MNGETIGITIAVVSVLLALAALTPFLRAKQTQATIELLRSELDVEREARQEQAVRCTAEVAELRGQMKVLTDGFALTVAKVVAREVVVAMKSNGRS